MDLPNEEFYYSGDNCEYFHAGNDNEVVKKLIEKSIIKKVRIQKEFDLFLYETRKEIVEEIVDTIEKLEVYYNVIIADYNKNTENDSKNYSNLNNKEKSLFGWIIPCNPKYYDVVGAFNELHRIEWKQSTNIKVGDIVYIYVGGPYKEIKYKCVAKRVDLSSAERIDDSKYILNDANYKNYGRYMELELLVKYEEQQCPFTKVKQYGPKSIQKPSRVTKELDNYIKLLELNHNKILLDENNNADGALLRDINLIVRNDKEYDYNYENKPKIKQNPTIQNGIKIHKRDKRVSINALANAKFLCEVNNKHFTFIRKNTDLNYTEPHHLIPMAYSDMFTFSLDVEENMVSLCSNCHNQIHYGRDYKDMLKKLYDERIEKLKKVGLYITFEELLEKY